MASLLILITRVLVVKSIFIYSHELRGMYFGLAESKKAYICNSKLLLGKTYPWPGNQNYDNH